MDVVETGRPDKPPRTLPRLPRPVLALAVTTAALVLGATTAPVSVARPVPVPVVPVGPLETVPPEAIPDPNISGAPYVVPSGTWHLEPAGVRTGLWLAGGGDGLYLHPVDGGRDRSVGVPGTEDLATVHVLGRVAAGWVVRSEELCDADACVNSNVYVMVGRRPVRVGRGYAAYPDPDGRTLWLVRTTGPTYDTAVVEHRTAYGTRLGRRFALAKQESLAGIAADGPVIERDDTGAVSVADRVTGHRRVLPPAGRVLAVAARRVAVLTRCGKAGCAVSVVDLRTSRGARPFVIAGAAVFGTFDPAGRRLALALPADVHGGAVVVDTATRTTTTLEELPSIDVGAFGWSPDGRWLLLARSVTDEQGLYQGQQLALWRPGWEAPRDAGTAGGAPGDQLVLSYVR